MLTLSITPPKSLAHGAGSSIYARLFVISRMFTGACPEPIGRGGNCAVTSGISVGGVTRDLKGVATAVPKDDDLFGFMGGCFI